MERKKPRASPKEQKPLTARDVAVYLRGLLYAWEEFEELTTAQEDINPTKSYLDTVRRGSRDHFEIRVRKLKAYTEHPKELERD